MSRACRLALAYIASDLAANLPCIAAASLLAAPRIISIATWHSSASALYHSIVHPTFHMNTCDYSSTSISLSHCTFVHPR
jgi:hypothetical protein